MSSAEQQHANNSRKKLMALTIGALGVVYGDIGTSPLYAINEVFFGHNDRFQTPEQILGILSLVVWSLTLIISIKYLTFVLRADNDGEGGVFALYSRFHQYKTGPVAILKVILMLAAGLLFGEGIITPAISVLSAVEGLEIITPDFQSLTIPITVGILTAIFAIQYKGSSLVGKLFGPIATLWFLLIGILGFQQVYQHPAILAALNPVYAFQFLSQLDVHQAFLVLGSIMLVITGGEALFADMGHFGSKPIRRGWFSIVYPALLLNYFGQGAFVLSNSKVINQNIFYSMVPTSILPFVVIVATMATVIASQALISGAFSLTSQAIALGLFPRLKTIHTHEEHAGQIYLGFVNWMLYIGAIALVLGFKTSNALASAYGLSVSGVMFATSLAMLAISILFWQWSPLKAIGVFGVFALIDGTFLISNSLKFLEGGFIPLLIGFIIFSIMRIWRWGRKSTYAAYTAQKTISMKELVELKEKSTELIDRCVVLMVPKPIQSLEDNTPALLQFFINRYGLLPKHLFLVEVIHKKVPYIHGLRHESFTFFKDSQKGSIHSVQIEFGFMEEPNVEKALESLAVHHQISLPSDPHKWLVHVAHEHLIAPKTMYGFKRLRFRLFLLFRQITQPAYFYYGLGREVNLSLDIVPIKIK